MAGTALYIGRFQPFHNGHFHAVKHISTCYERVIVAIGSAQDSYSEKNPWSAGERYEMISRTIQKAGITNCLIIPIDDINRNYMWTSHVISKCPEFQTVFSNNKLTCTLFEKIGYKVLHIPRKSASLSGRGGSFVESGTQIRKLMQMGMKWWQYVPKEVYDYMRERNLDRRLGEIE